jgi:hypothetical protein
MIDWSITNLPLPETLQVTNRSASIRTKAESGRYIQRRRWTTPYDEGTLTFKFLKEQFQIFRGVWIHYLDDGVESFTIDLPVGGNTTLTNCEVKFVSDYSYKYVSVDYVTVQVRIEFKQVEAPDKLALDNLINVGDIVLQREVDTVTMTWSNLDGSQTQYAVRPTFTVNTGSYVSQNFDGTTKIGTFATSNKLPATTVEEFFVTNHYPCLSTNNQDPNPSGELRTISVFSTNAGAAYLRSFDWNATSHYFRKIDFVGTNYWNPPLPNGEAKLIVKSTFESIRLSDADLLEKLTIEIEQDGVFERQSTAPLTVNNCNLLTTISSSAPVGYNCPINKIDIYSNPLLSSLDLTDFVQTLPFSSVDKYSIYSNQSLTQIDFTGTATSYKTAYRLDNNDLNTITITGGDLWIDGSGSHNTTLANNNFTVQDLKLFVDNLKGHPDGTQADNTINLNGNPCWLSGEFNPSAFDNSASITSYSSTATDFEVTTASAHSLTTGDYVKIEGASVSSYNGIWLVASTPTTTTFTIDDTTNAGAATGGTFKTEADADAAYVEITGWNNNISFIT